MTSVCVALVAGAVVWLLHSEFSQDGFLFLDPPVVAAVAYLGGRTSGFAASVVTFLAAWYLIIPPAGWAVTPATVPILILFAAVLGGTVEVAVRLRRAETASRQLAIIVQSTGDAIMSATPDGLIRTWNAGAERLYGYSAAEAIGQPVTILSPPDRVPEMLERVGELKRRQSIMHFESVRIKKDGTAIDVLVTLSPLWDTSGALVGGSVIWRDISDRKRRERRQRFLVDAANVLGASLDLQQTLEAFADLAVPTLADWCIVDLLDADGGLRRCVAAHADPAKHAAAQALGEMSPEDTRSRPAVAEVVRTGRSVLYEDLPDVFFEETVQDERARALFRALGLKSMVVVPLIARGRTLGTMGFAMAESARRYTRDDLEFAEELARHVALALDNAQLHREEQTNRATVERLQAITADLSRAVTTADVAAAVVDQAFRAFDARAGIVALNNEDRTALETVGITGLDEAMARRWHRIGVGTPDTPVLAVARTGVPLFFESLEVMAKQYPAVFITGLGLPPGGRAVLPLQTGDEPFGALLMVFADRREFSERDRTLLLAIARQCALALERARALEAERSARISAEEAAARIARLQAVTAALSEAITPEQAGEAVANHAIRALAAQAVSVSLLSADAEVLDLVSAVGYPDGVSARWRGVAVGRVPMLAEAIRTQQVVWRESHDDEPVLAVAPDGLPDPMPLGSRAAVPLVSRGRSIGVLYIHFAERRRLAARDLEFMLTFGQQCAQAVDRARLYAQEHRVAETLQHALLPLDLPAVPGLRVHATYVPGSPVAEVGGDWYDAFRLPDGRLALAIGDVVGHGLDAAVIMGQVRQTIRAAALEHRTPAAVLAVVNEVLQLGDADDAMTTAVFGVLDPIALTFTYATAAHPAPIIVADGHARALSTGGLPLGLWAEQPVPSWTVELDRGSMLVLYTDGLVELSRDVIVGEAALFAAVESEWSAGATDPAMGILERVVGAQTPGDDIAVVAVVLDAEPLERLDLALPAVPGSLRPIRQAMQQLCQNVRADEQRASGLIIAIGEAVNNVIEHAYGVSPGTVRVQARRDGAMLRVEIEDGGQWRAQPRRDHGGRGIMLMRALVDAVEIEKSERGTTVRLAIAIPPGPSESVPPRIAPVARNVSLPRAATPGPHQIDGLARLEVGRAAGAPVVSIVGDLDRLNIDRFTGLLEQAVAQADRVVILSLLATSYLDSRGIQALLQTAARIATHRCRLVLVASPDSPVRRLLDAAGIGAILPVRGTMEEAMADDDFPA